MPQIDLAPTAFWDDLDTVKLWLQIPDAEGSADDVLALIVNGVCEGIERRLSRVIRARELTETYDAPDGPDLLLRQFPVIEVASITLNGVEMSPDDYTVDTRLGRIRLGSNLNYAGWADWDETTITGDQRPGFQNIVVVYTAGYENVPESLILAAVEAIKFVRDRQQTGGIQATSINLGTLGTIALATSIPKDVRDAMDAFRRKHI